MSDYEILSLVLMMLSIITSLSYIISTTVSQSGLSGNCLSYPFGFTILDSHSLIFKKMFFFSI